MYPTISDFLKDVFGWDVPLPLQSYGLFVALAFLTGIGVVALEMKRKWKEGLLHPISKKTFVGEAAKPKELIISALIGFIIGYKLLEGILDYDALVKDPQGFVLSLKGSFIGGIIGAAISAFFTWRDKNKQKLDKPHWETQEILPHQLSGNMLVVTGIFGLLGAKLFHNLEYFQDLLDNPIDELFSFSGLTFFGGVVVGAIATAIFAKKKNLSIIQMGDAAVVAISIAYAVGRIGCQVSGDGCWGIENIDPQPEWLSWLPDWLWAYDYPNNILSEGIAIPGCELSHCNVLANPVYPTPLYESLIMIVIFTVLWSLRKRIKLPGILLCLYFILAGFERFLIEQIRVNIPYKIFGYEITQAEIISFLMIIGGITGLILIFKNKQKLLAQRQDLIDKSKKIT